MVEYRGYNIRKLVHLPIWEHSQFYILNVTAYYWKMVGYSFWIFDKTLDLIALDHCCYLGMKAIWVSFLKMRGGDLKAIRDYSNSIF